MEYGKNIFQNIIKETQIGRASLAVKLAKCLEMSMLPPLGIHPKVVFNNIKIWLNCYWDLHVFPLRMFLQNMCSFRSFLKIFVAQLASEILCSPKY